MYDRINKKLNIVMPDYTHGGDNKQPPKKEKKKRLEAAIRVSLLTNSKKIHIAIYMNQKQ